jgi:succinoglycan biosynthesis protein ExoM
MTTPHITVCICTYRRSRLLTRLLRGIERQETRGRFTYSIVVIDNDRQESSSAAVSEFAEIYPVPVTYCVEPQQGIALARNKAVAHATGEYAAFIDDDEFPSKRWLLTLWEVCNQYDADGVLGPVKRHFDEQPPEWIIKAGFYDRPVRSTGLAVGWKEARTGNVLLKKHVLDYFPQPFRPEFRSGEDVDFFRRAMESGFRFVWSSEAVAYEVVPPIRWNRRFMLRRALLRGTIARKQPSCGARSIAKSLVAVPAYTAALPVALLLGQHRFMDLAVRLCDHLGKLLALVGINAVREPYVTG